MRHEIIKVKLGEDPFSKFLTHIQAVMLGDGSVLSVPEVIRSIQSGDEFFYTQSFWNQSAKVIAAPVSNPTYIKTEANDMQQDNLLSLPRF
ncbi:DUF3892 domain-containing protein [Weissella cibaria]|uniref:DUF3892 domain-containing protein n=1 Tax=Weissella cibaria TaxID=137591 RepID=UPI00189BD151|nr:DUF3892 domain-containing protein [Weissella cibaria]